MAHECSDHAVGSNGVISLWLTLHRHPFSSSRRLSLAPTCHLPRAGAAAVYLSEQQLSSLITTVLGKLQAGGVKADVTRSYVQTVAQLRWAAQHGPGAAQAGAAAGAAGTVNRSQSSVAGSWHCCGLDMQRVLLPRL